MTGKEITRQIIEKKGIKQVDMAFAMGITPQKLWDRLNTAKTTNISTEKLNSMLQYLGYELVIMPRGRASRIDDAYVVEDGESK